MLSIVDLIQTQRVSYLNLPINEELHCKTVQQRAEVSATSDITKEKSLGIW